MVYLIGNPVDHSISPQIHNAAFQNAEIPYIYKAKQISRKELPHFIKRIKESDSPGFNITIPYKSEVFEYIRIIDPTTQEIGAINTVKNENGILKGYNTDLDGIHSAVLAANFKISPDQKIVIIGAGGAARSVAYYFSTYELTNISILSRSIHKAERMRRDFRKNNRNLFLSDYPSILATKKLENADLIVNATPVGMWPDMEDNILMNYIPNATQAIFDLVYNPVETTLVKIGKQQQCKIISGIDMLVYQAAKSFKYWTGVHPDIKLMKKKAIERLQFISSKLS